jgi:hypothetical protein
MEYYLFLYCPGNFPLRAIYLPIKLLPKSYLNNYEYLYNKYGQFIYINNDSISKDDFNKLYQFVIYSDGSPAWNNVLFGKNFDEEIDDYPEYYIKSIFYYDNNKNRLKFNIDINTNSLQHIYQKLSTKYPVKKTIIFYDEL